MTGSTPIPPDHPEYALIARLLSLDASGLSAEIEKLSTEDLVKVYHVLRQAQAMVAATSTTRSQRN